MSKNLDLSRIADVEAIVYEKKMTDESEFDLFLSPEALSKFKNANIANQASVIKTYSKRKIWKQDKLKIKNNVKIYLF